jgi:hypothetical protein
MNRRLILAGLAATGGLVTTAFLQVAVAAADAPSATGADAFTIGDFTFDPYTSPGVEGFSLVDPLSSAPPLLTLGGGTIDGILPLATQNFDVYNSSGATLGSVDTNETVTSLLGLTNTEFTVSSVDPASGETAADLPATGTVYDAFNLGNGVENIYVATPGTDGTVTDTLVTPTGDYNLSSLFGDFNAANPLSPGDAFTGLESGDSSIGADAFSIGGYTLDPFTTPGTEGFAPVAALGGAPPLLDLGGGGLGNPGNAGDDFATQSFDVYTGSGSSATDIGTITTGEDVTNLLGLTNTELIVATSTGGATAAGLPATGTVYDALNLGNGVENVYVATPGSDGTVTDTLVTPYGDVNLSSLFSDFNAANPLNPGDAFTGLESGDSSIGADAFTIGNTTFDPFTVSSGTDVEGFAPVYQTIGSPPLLEIGGGTPTIFGTTLAAAPQDFDVYSGSGSSATEVGSIVGNEDVTDLLGLTNTEFTVASVTGTSSDLPTVGSVYDVFNLGDGIENVYTAIPGVDGAADTITDTLVTPLGNLNLDSLFGGIDAVALLNPGDAFTAGLDAASAAATAVDPLAFLGL